MPGQDPKKFYRVGLTGGIASGKSTIADMFCNLGVPVIDTDIVAREVVQPGEPALAEIRNRFGGSIIDSNGALDRSSLRRLIFSDTDARVALDAIMHPRIGAETRRQADAAAGPYQLIVVPLLVGSPLIQFVDRILLVDCSEEIQIKRLMKRDAESIQQARKILAAQASRSDRLAIANDVISSEDTLAETREHIKDLDEMYRRLAALACQRGQSPESA